MILVWENNKWVIDRLTNREYTGIQPKEPMFKPGETALYRNNIVKIEWANYEVESKCFYYDVRKENFHSFICLEKELSYLNC